MLLTTWNVFHGRSPEDLRVDAGRLADAVASLGPDVLALQEVDRGQPRSDHVDVTAVAAEAMGAAHARFVPTVIGEPGFSWRAATVDDAGAAADAYGVALLSRLPVESWHVLRLPPVRAVRVPVPVPGTRLLLWLRDEPRVVLAARLRSRAGLLTVASTHLSFVPGANVVQLRRAARWLRTLGGPAVLLGDLNLPAAVADRTPGLRVLARARTHPASRPRWQLDHALGSTGVPRVVRAEARRLPVSDHLALQVELEGT
ncbi:endonuclease/exonuclease/phosphatase family protein [Georgenia wangjunii]|uniref:endonuclease/exonuclease/phosphatase family protein n=1 Tax=Georgenia wangjunii TaxID=3117730 RepID=UPI002F266F3E